VTERRGLRGLLSEALDSRLLSHDDDIVDIVMQAIGKFRLELQVSREQVEKITAARMVRILGATLWQAQPADLKERAYRAVYEELIMAGVEVEALGSPRFKPVKHLADALTEADRAYCAAHGLDQTDPDHIQALAQHAVAPHQRARRHLKLGGDS
jgi:hypothetical protein